MNPSFMVSLRIKYNHGSEVKGIPKEPVQYALVFQQKISLMVREESFWKPEAYTWVIQQRD